MFCRFKRKIKQSDGRNQVDEVDDVLQFVRRDEGCVPRDEAKVMER